MASYDDIINGTFNSLNPGVAGMYAGIYPPTSAPSYQGGMMGRGLLLSASNRLPQGSAGIDPIGWSPPAATPNAGPSWNTPTPIDLAAIERMNAQNSPGGSMMGYANTPRTTPALSAATAVGGPNSSVTAAMKPQGWQGLLSMLFGPSKNGLTGIPGLLGGQNAGGLLGQLFRQQNNAPAAPVANFGGGREVVNSNGNYVTSNGEWHYSDPAHSGFTPISNNQSLS